MPTSAGVFGIARTTGRPGTSCSMVAIVTPAAIDNTSVPESSAGSAVSSVAATSPGFTATTTTSASATAHAALGTTRTFRNCCSSADRRSPSISAIDTSSASQPPSSSPPTSAAPIFPPPSSATRDIDPRVTVNGGITCGDRTPRGRARARGTFGPAPHFPERSRPSRTSGPSTKRTVARRADALQDILRHSPTTQRFG